MKTEKKQLIILAGPTAVGKTAMAISLANQFSAPILSFDSRQFYKEMSIGTAKPNSTELAQAEHHFIGNLSIHDTYTSGKFETDALAKLNLLFKKHNIVVAVGGSGLYINALCYGIDDIPTNETVRNKLIQRWKDEGLEALQHEVQKFDPEYYLTGDMQNPRRVIRALEVFEVSGKPFSFYRKNQAKIRPFKTSWIGLELEREILFERINSRVDEMIRLGLLEEVQKLYKFKHLKALKTVGYQEFFEAMDNHIATETAIEFVKRNTRVFAKKQMAWFKRNQDVTWFSPYNQIEINNYLTKKIIH